MLKKVYQYAILSMAVLFLGVFLTGCHRSGSRPDVAQLWGVLGAGVFDILKNPETVEFYKITAVSPGADANSTHYPPQGKVSLLEAENVKTLQTILLNDNSYLFGVTKKCLFVPETAFHFKKDGKELTLLVSMSCKQVTYDLGEQSIRLDIDPSEKEFAEFISDLPTN